MIEKLVKIDRKNWSKLRDLYSPHDPNTFLGHCVVDNYIQWFKKDPHTKNIVIYGLSDDWSDGTFVAIDRRYVSAHTLAQSTERLANLLKLIDLSKGYIFLHILEKDYSAISDAFKLQEVKIEKNLEFLYYHLPQANALEFDIIVPDGFTLKHIEQSDVRKIEKVWPHRHSGSLKLLEDIVRWNCQIGLYNETGQLVAWALRLPDGPLGPLQVDDNYTGRGIGRIVCKETLRQIASSGKDNVAMIFEWNAPSRAIFEKLGFQLQTGKIYRIFSLPTDA